MMILLEASEARSGTRLPANVIEHATVITGLEALTGADLILSPLDRPTLKALTKCPASVQALKIHCRAGCLIQRKSGSDFIGSIGKLAEIEYRMSQWGLPWLLVTGEFRCTPAQKVIVNGRKTGYSYWAIPGALDSWILRGGGVTILPRDNLTAKWLSDMAKRLSELETPQLILPQRPVQKLTHEAELDQIVATLMTFKGMGSITAVTIAKQCKTLRESFKLLSDPNVLRRPDKPPGVGPKLIEEFRSAMSLGSGDRIL
jgi:ERCC4-type nuclease